MLCSPFSTYINTCCLKYLVYDESNLKEVIGINISKKVFHQVRDVWGLKFQNSYSSPFLRNWSLKFFLTSNKIDQCI